MVYPLTTFGDEWHPVICVTPLVASIIAQAGYSKGDVGRYLYENARIPAYLFEEFLHQEKTELTIAGSVEQGELSSAFYESEDPNRLVPLLHDPDEFFIVVSGMAQRNRAFVMAQLGVQGLATSREIRLPANWIKLINTSKG
jgi:hypothetical protein